jgi:hypothetical protein
MWIELLRSKDEALSYLKKVKARAETELEGKLKPSGLTEVVNSIQINSLYFVLNLGSSTTLLLHIPLSKME